MSVKEIVKDRVSEVLSAELEPSGFRLKKGNFTTQFHPGSQEASVLIFRYTAPTG